VRGVPRQHLQSRRRERAVGVPGLPGRLEHHWGGGHGRQRLRVRRWVRGGGLDGLRAVPRWLLQLRQDVCAVPCGELVCGSQRHHLQLRLHRGELPSGGHLCGVYSNTTGLHVCEGSFGSRHRKLPDVCVSGREHSATGHHN